MNLNKFITDRKDFRPIVVSVVKQMFVPLKSDLGTFSSPYKSVYIDVNSVTSIIYRYDNLDDEDMCSQISIIIEDFIDTCISRGITVYFLYSSQKSLVHSSIYPTWCEKRYERVNMKKSNFIMQLLGALKKFSTQNNLVRIENTGDKHAAHVIKQLHVDNVHKGAGLVISKDYVCQGLIFISNITIFTGVNIIDYRDTAPELYDRVNVLPLLPKRSLYWVYPCLCRDPKNEYTGAKQMGSHRVAKYMTEHRIALFLNSEHPLKEFLEKHAPLYDINKMIEVYNNMKEESGS
ncbi:MAG: hypothetical protein ACRC92_27145 [Peptostreptococcaceae bacterium]